MYESGEKRQDFQPYQSRNPFAILAAPSPLKALFANNHGDEIETHSSLKLMNANLAPHRPLLH